MESEGASSNLGLIGSKDVDLMTKSLKLGLIGLKSFDPATYSAQFGRLCRLPAGFEKEARFDRPKRCQFYPGQLRNSSSLTGGKFQTASLIWARPAGGSATDASAFWDLLDPPMWVRVVSAGFGDYAAGLRRTQPRFPPAMRYALMEWWNDCTHTFVFGFGEMTLTPVDYAAITGLRFTGPVPLLDA
ncbi:hypothetical protein JCGZ_15554 [Jatropha curcas]|uniref:Aminotransferase-like plant mobile domain-containing protein n=1 Tax=Jatropha curcas TaxID=180498 RepID=A0A067KFS8_JATCU|nr:hypothetical protein JCGZ_15554 [Jatropha curcas]